MPFSIVRQDITQMQVDAIVNAANTELEMGGGVCGAIFQAAGVTALRAACRKVAPIPTGGAVLTPGFNLPAKYIIHAAGPVYRSWDAAQSERLLRLAYLESLRLARRHRCASIAFPLISSGIYGYPKDQALKVAVDTISAFLLENEMMVYIVIFDKKAYQISGKLFADITAYIDDRYVKEHSDSREEQRWRSEPLIGESCFGSAVERMEAKPSYNAISSRTLEDALNQIDESFSEMLLRKIDESDMTDMQCYKKANIDRKLFSKIRSNKFYKPSKTTVLAFALAIAEMQDMLGKAGFTLSRSSKFDIIVEYFVEQGNYNVYEINEALFAFDQSLIGS